MKRTSYLLLCLSVLLLAQSFRAMAQETAETGDVLLKAIPQSKNALFNSNEPIRYKLEVRNNTKQPQNGHISYLVTTDEGKKIAQDSVRINLRGGASRDIGFTIPKKAAGTGFYPGTEVGNASLVGVDGGQETELKFVEDF